MKKNIVVYLGLILGSTQSQPVQIIFDIGIGRYPNSTEQKFQVAEFDTTIIFKWYPRTLSCPNWMSGDFDLEKLTIGRASYLFSEYINGFCMLTDSIKIDSTVGYKFFSKNKTEYIVKFVKIQGTALVMEFSISGSSGIGSIKHPSSTSQKNRIRFKVDGSQLKEKSNSVIYQKLR